MLQILKLQVLRDDDEAADGVSEGACRAAAARKPRPVMCDLVWRKNPDNDLWELHYRYTAPIGPAVVLRDFSIDRQVRVTWARCLCENGEGYDVKMIISCPNFILHELKALDYQTFRIIGAQYVVGREGSVPVRELARSQVVLSTVDHMIRESFSKREYNGNGCVILRMKCMITLHNVPETTVATFSGPELRDWNEVDSTYQYRRTAAPMARK